MRVGEVLEVNGPVITIGGDGFSLAEVVEIAGRKGEIIAVAVGGATAQVYGVSAGLWPGLAVTGTGKPMSVTLQPGIVGHIFDGIMQRLDDAPATWKVEVTAKIGQELQPGDVFATVQETPLITYKAMCPSGVFGKVVQTSQCGKIILNTGRELTLAQTWPIRVPRPVKQRRALDQPLITGQRVIDSLFPIAKGGAVAIPGGFGTGKTMLQHQLAKWCDADLIVYIGCGERGNEMTEVLEDFAKLVDPKNNRPLLERTVLIANTSDMPVAAREASIYTGITIAECYRDMGYHVAVMADSTSRWAEALRELSGRLGEIPAEEGYPAYLASRLSAFYGRAGYVTNLNDTEGSVTIIGAVSPQGGDFNEPVTQQTKRFTSCYLALDRRLAYARHYPAIDWNASYSGYVGIQKSPDELGLRKQLLDVLHQETDLLEIAGLIGTDALSQAQQKTLQLAKEIRVRFLQQNAYDPADTFMPPEAQYRLIQEILHPFK